MQFLVWLNFGWHLSSSYLRCIFQACLVGIVVPDPDFLPIWIKKKGIEGSYSELCNNKVRFITISSPNTQSHLLCMLTFFWLFLGCEECHSGGHPEIGQRSRTQVFWAGDTFKFCIFLFAAFGLKQKRIIPRDEIICRLIDFHSSTIWVKKKIVICMYLLFLDT